MSYFINPVGEDQCVFLSYEGEMPALELSAVRYEANAVLDQRHWNRLVVDITQLQSVPTSLELLDFVWGLSSSGSQAIRVALVIRPVQERQARFVEKVARNERVFLTCFLDPEQATAWVKQTNLRPARPVREAGVFA